MRVFHCFFSNGKDNKILSGTGFLQAFEKVDIITASQTAVSGDYNVTILFTGRFSGINGGKIQISFRNVHQSLMELPEIGTADICAVLGFPKLGGGDKFHGLGDLHGALHTLDPEFYGFHICSHKDSSCINSTFQRRISNVWRGLNTKALLCRHKNGFLCF